MARTGAAPVAPRANADGRPPVGAPGIDILSAEEFAAVAETEIERTRSRGTPLSMLSIGVDRVDIESAADTAPDAAVVPALAKTCSGLLRATDVVGRVDEATVVVLLPGTSARSTLSIAERLRTAMAAFSAVDAAAKRRQATVSIGAVTTRTGRATYRALRSRADAKRDDARHRGGNRGEI